MKSAPVKSVILERVSLNVPIGVSESFMFFEILPKPFAKPATMSAATWKTVLLKLKAIFPIFPATSLMVSFPFASEPNISPKTAFTVLTKRATGPVMSFPMPSVMSEKT